MMKMKLLFYEIFFSSSSLINLIGKKLFLRALRENAKEEEVGM